MAHRRPKLLINLSFLSVAIMISPYSLADTKNDHTRNTTQDDASVILDNLENNLNSGNKASTESLETTSAENNPKNQIETAPSQQEEPKKIIDKPASPLQTSKSSSQFGKQNKKSIKDIDAKIKEFDHRIDILESDLARIQSTLHDSSVTDNRALIEIRALDSAQFIIRTINAKLDGLSLYNQSDSAGIWTPNQTITVFHGPLTPGSHRLSIDGVIAPLSKDGLKLPTLQHKAVQASFEIVVPEGRSRKHYVVELSDDASANSKPRVKLAESDYQ